MGGSLGGCVDGLVGGWVVSGIDWYEVDCFRRGDPVVFLIVLS